MKSRSRSLLLVTSVLCIWTPSADAGSTLLPWVGISGRFGTYAMRDVNEDIRRFDNQLTANFEDISRGWGIGGEVGIQFGRVFGISANVERLRAQSKVQDRTGKLTYDAGGRAVFASFVFRVPSPQTTYGASVGIGGISTKGEIVLEIVREQPESVTLEGSGTLVQWMLFAEIGSGALVRIQPSVGYRSAVATGIDLDGDPIFSVGGQPFEVDYSGFVAMITLKLRFGAD